MKKHKEDLKREAVRIALSSGLSRRRVASDLGLAFQRWASGYASIGPPILPGIWRQSLSMAPSS